MKLSRYIGGTGWNDRFCQSAVQTNIASARFFAGDWMLLGLLLSSLGLANSFDMVVSAETIYSSASMRALFACVKQVSLHNPHCDILHDRIVNARCDSALQ